MAKKTIPALEWVTTQRIVNDLINYKYNPRILTQAEAAQLTASLNKFNVVEIPAINTDNVILAGHMRVAILKQLGRGDEAIDVRIPNRPLTDEEVKEYNIRSNKNTGSWDMDMLLNDNDQEFLIEIGFKPYEFGVVDDKPEKTTTERHYSIAYEMIFETEVQKKNFKIYLEKIKSVFPEAISEASALLAYFEKNLA